MKVKISLDVDVVIVSMECVGAKTQWRGCRAGFVVTAGSVFLRAGAGPIQSWVRALLHLSLTTPTTTSVTEQKDGGLRLSVKVGLDQVAPSKKAPFFR
jgi:hypothetical protein